MTEHSLVALQILYVTEKKQLTSRGLFKGRKTTNLYNTGVMLADRIRNDHLHHRVCNCEQADTRGLL